MVDGGIMLNIQDLINKMKLHFPRWMDIRKRVEKSYGGNLLTSVAECTAEIQDAINDFKKDFFITGYLGREDDIVAFVYRLFVGETGIDTITITEPNLKFAKDLDEFYSQTGLAFYDQGYLFFRVEDIEPNNKKIKYEINGFETSGMAEKIHVWNVFDEFAAFVGLQRHEGETNKDLEERILNVFRRRPNSTEQGLKNAILNELSILEPGLTEDEIDISRPTPDNLVKYYKEFGSVIEKLAHINRDVYRTKRWDLDTWNYSFKSIDYVPHAWDVFIDAYQNGVGFEDDLKVVLTSPDDTTNARVTFYAESNSVIQEYVRKKDVKTNIDLKLTQYNDTLNPITAKYRITASKAKDITGEPIRIECSETTSGEHERYVQDIASEDMRDITVIDNSILPANKNYKLVFSSQEEYGNMFIEKCDLITDDNTTSLLREKSGFMFNAGGVLYNKNVKLHVTQRHQLLNYINIINASNGMAIDDLTREGIIAIDATGMGNEFFQTKFNCPTTAIPNSAIKMSGFEVYGENITTTSNADEKYVEIDIEANQVTFDMIEGNYTIEIVTDDIVTKIGNGATKIATDIKKTPIRHLIRITPIGTGIVTISNIRYSKFDIDFSLEKGNFVIINNKMVLPQDNTNIVYIHMRTYTGYSPILEYANIGTSIANSKYETDIIPAASGIRRLDVKTNCKMTLIEVDENGNQLASIDNYEPYKRYKATSDQAYIKLNTNEYNQVDYIKGITGRFESIGTGENITYYIRLRKDEIISKITISGKRLINARSITLTDALGVNPAAGDIIYANELLKAFVVVKNGNQELKRIVPSSILGTAESYKIIGLPDDINCAFVVNSNDNSVIISDSYTGRFQSMYMFPKDSNTYIAYNEYKMINKEARNVEIVDVFNPFLPTNSLMVYKVESLDSTGITDVKFDQEDTDFIMLNNWSVGRRPLRIISSIDMSSTINYSLSTINVDQEFSLREAIKLERTYTLSNGEIIELPRYIIEVPEGMQVQYARKQPFDTLITAPEFYCSEAIIKESDGFNKLKYSNIDEIIYIGTTPYDAEVAASISNDNYTLLNREGIIVWNKDEIADGQTVYILYTIQIPDYINVDIRYMYKVIGYSLDAYRELGYREYSNIKAGDTIDLKNVPYYLQSNRIVVNCDQPGFEAKLGDDGVVTFSRVSYSNVIAVKTGYYYVDGQEYYLFANESADSIEKFMNVEFFNVVREEDNMILNKRSRNYIKNSYMDLGPIADIYNMDFERENNVYGISKLNSITACDNFNHWHSFGADLSITKGYNGAGIRIDSILPNGYAFIDITDYMLPDTFLSFYCKGDVKAYIGREIKFQDLSFKRSVLVEPIVEIQRSTIEPDIMQHRFAPNPDYRYYLIIKGNGVIDDIILLDGINSAQKGFHTKNITTLNFNIEEKIATGYTSRLLLDNMIGGKSKGAEIDATGTIINSSMIDWGITKIKEFNEPDTWKRCVTNKVSITNGVAQTNPNVPGTIETEPVYVGDKRAIKNLVFEINDVLFDNMKGFTIRILTSDTLLGDYRIVSTHKDDIGYVRGSNLSNYVKLKIDMPGGKIINDISIYLEYKSTKEAAPKATTANSGTFITGVLDTHYSAKYKVKGISIESISNINDVDIQIRGAKENYAGEVWTDWKAIKLDNDGITNNVVFDGYRFFQAKITLKNKNAFVKLKHIDLEVV